MQTLLLLLAVTATKPQLAKAELLYDDYQYDKAAQAFTAALADPTFVDGPSRQRARMLLAFSYVWLKREGDAKRELRTLFAENVDFPIERTEHHPSLVKLYDTERGDYLRAARPVVVKRRSTLGDDMPFLRIFPAGIGHFANHDFVAGGVFLGLEAALVMTNVVATILWYGLRAPDGLFKKGAQPVPLQITMDVTAIAAITTAVIEIVDAFAWSPARGRANLQ